jgi:predicted amidohydrolase
MLNLALLQLLPCCDKNENLKKGVDFCRRAKTMGADIALFPEMFSCGYNIPENQPDVNALAIPQDDEFITSFGKLAIVLATECWIMPRFTPAISAMK